MQSSKYEIQVNINESVEKIYKAYNEIKEIKNQSSYFGNYDLALTEAFIQDLLTVATTSMEYSSMLLDRNSLELEGFLIPKLDRMIITLMNCKTRINQLKK